jgi:hypothetical protein
MLIGCGGMAASAQAETRYYDPTNVGGNTTNYELYRTIGCPGKQLFDKSCIEPVAQPMTKAAAPAPIPSKPDVLIKSNLPSAKPGECYGKVVTKPEFTSTKLREMVKPASERIEVVPAEYQTVKEKCLVKEASQRIEVVPAVWETVQEKILLRPAYRRAIEIPALYDTVTETTLVRPAYSTWKPGKESNIQKIDEKTGEIYCLVEVPAEYKTESRKVLRTPASVRYEDVDAEYGMVTKQVLKSAETTRVIDIPAEYVEREVVKMVRAPQVKRIAVPAEYTEIDGKVLAATGAEEWHQILCADNATPAKVSEIQRALQASGFNPGAIDGNLNAQTMSAVAAFQKARNLPVDGFLNMDTVKALGISPK